MVRTSEHRGFETRMRKNDDDVNDERLTHNLLESRSGLTRWIFLRGERIIRVVRVKNPIEWLDHL